MQMAIWDIQGVPQNMTFGELFRMSSSIYRIRYLRRFAVYLVKQIFFSNMFYFKINFTITWQSICIFYYSLRYQTT